MATWTQSLNSRGVAPPTGSVLERLEQQRRALPEGARPNARESAAEPRGKMFAQRFGTPGGRGTCGSGQERTWSRRKRGRRLARGVTKKCFMLPESGPDLRSGIRPRFEGRNPANKNTFRWSTAPLDRGLSDTLLTVSVRRRVGLARRLYLLNRRRAELARVMLYTSHKQPSNAHVDRNAVPYFGLP